MRYSVVALEDGIAVLEDTNGQLLNIEVYKLPDTLKEGQILIYEDNKFIIDFDETAKKRRRIFEKFNSVKNSKK